MTQGDQERREYRQDGAVGVDCVQTPVSNGDGDKAINIHFVSLREHVRISPLVVCRMHQLKLAA